MPSASGAPLPPRVSLLFAAIFVVAGTNLPYLPVWLDWAGLGPREIAVITAAPLFVRVAVTPVIALCRRSGRRPSPLPDRPVLGGPGRARRCCRSRAASGRSSLCTLLFALAWTTDHAADRDGGDERRAGPPASTTDACACGARSASSRRASSAAGWWRGWAPAPAIWLVVGGMVLTTLRGACPGAAHRARPARRRRPVRRGCRSPTPSGLLRSRMFLLFLLAAGAVQAAHAVLLHVRHAALARARPLRRVVRRPVGDLASCPRSALFAFSRAVAGAHRRPSS